MRFFIEVDVQELPSFEVTSVDVHGFRLTDPDKSDEEIQGVGVICIHPVDLVLVKTNV